MRTASEPPLQFTMDEDDPGVLERPGFAEEIPGGPGLAEEIPERPGLAEEIPERPWFAEDTPDGPGFAQDRFACRGRSGRSHGRGRGRGINKRPEKRWIQDAEARDEGEARNKAGRVVARDAEARDEGEARNKAGRVVARAPTPAMRQANNDPKRELWRILNGFQNSDNYGIYISEQLRDPRRHYINNYYEEVAGHCVGIRDLGSSLGRLSDPVSGECRQGFVQLAGTLRRLAGRIEAAVPP